MFRRNPTQFPADRFTYDLFEWAFVMLFSRAARLASKSAGEELALVPYADLLNHNPYSTFMFRFQFNYNYAVHNVTSIYYSCVIYMSTFCGVFSLSFRQYILLIFLSHVSSTNSPHRHSLPQRRLDLYRRSARGPAVYLAEGRSGALCRPSVQEVRAGVHQLR